MRHIAAWPLYMLVLLLPFDSPRPIVAAFGLEFTLLEIAAALAFLASASVLVLSGELGNPLRTPGLVLALAFLGICFVSALAAGAPRSLPLKATLRVAAGVVAFLLASMTLRDASRVDRFLKALAVAGVIAAGVGLAEAAGVPGVESLTTLFRMRTYEVGGADRLSATFSYPNIAAGFFLLSLGGPVALLARRWRPTVATAAIVIFAALLLTYSRAALLGALVAPLAFAARTNRPAALRLTALAGSFVSLAIIFIILSPRFGARALRSDPERWYRARLLPDSSVLSLEPGAIVQTSVSIQNVGSRAWDSAGDERFELTCRWFDSAEGKVLDAPLGRSALPSLVAPGETVTLDARATAPRQEGDYVLIWEIAQPRATPFVEKVGLEQYVRASVGHAPPSDTTAYEKTIRGFVEGSWRPTRLELWKIAARLFRENPILGVGPDNYRFTYGRAAGRTEWDTRTSSNSLFLELLATTGLLGGVTFVSLLWIVLRGRQALSVGAGLVGFLLQGLFDYLLGFTSIYLTFWLSLGAAAAFSTIESRK